MRDLNARMMNKRSLCQSVTATTTGAAVDSGSAPVKGIAIVTNGGLDCTGGKTWTLTLEDSNDGSTYAAVDDIKLNGKLSATATRATETHTMAVGGGIDAEYVTIGTRLYEYDTDAAPGAITAGRVRVDISAAADAAACSAALTLAINGDPDAVVTAVDAGGGVVVVTAITEIAATGNAIVATDNTTNGSWAGGGTLAGGVDAIALSPGGTGAFAITTLIPTDGLRAILTYTGGKRYLRAVMTKAGAAPNIVTCVSVLYGTQDLPVVP